jgi:hypothetical protein
VLLCCLQSNPAAGSTQPNFAGQDSQQQVSSSSRPAGKVAKPAEEFQDAALLQQLDDALLQLEAEQQQQQPEQQQPEQQQPQRQQQQGVRAAGLSLPGVTQHTSKQQVL